MDASSFAVTATSDGPTATVAVEGELDLATADRLDAVLADVESNGSPTLVLDLHGVRFIDSTGLRCLLRARRRAVQDGRRLELARVSPEVARLLDMTGVTKIFDIASTL